MAASLSFQHYFVRRR